MRPGQSTLAFYTAENISNKVITGVSTYNVTPPQAGTYFNKIQCFCFEVSAGIWCCTLPDAGLQHALRRSWWLCRTSDRGLTRSEWYRGACRASAH